MTTQFKFTAPDGKKRAANVLDYDGIIELAKNFPSKQANRLLNGLHTVTKQSTEKANQRPMLFLIVPC